MKKVTNFETAIKRYQAEAQNFDNADGLYSSGFIGDGRMNYVGESNADGGMPQGDAFSALNDGERIYTVVITNTNTSGSAINAIVFGGDIYSGSTQPNAGVTVTVQESSHSQVRAESQRSPFWVNGLRYITTTNSQMTSQVPLVYRSTSAGKTESIPFRPLSFRTAYNQITTQVDAPNFRFLVDGSTYWSVPTIANETITIIFQIGGRWNSADAVKGQSPFQVANQSKLISGIGGIGQG